MLLKYSLTYVNGVTVCVFAGENISWLRK